MANNSALQEAINLTQKAKAGISQAFSQIAPTRKNIVDSFRMGYENYVKQQETKAIQKNISFNLDIMLILFR